MTRKLLIAGIAIALLLALPLVAAKAHDAMDTGAETTETTDKVKDAKEAKVAKEGKEGKLKGLLNALQHVPDHVKGLLQSILDGTKAHGKSA